jgi:Ca2+-binding EF-hand superfamily protein
MKHVGLGLHAYWHDSWNRFDGILVIVSYIGQIFEALSSASKTGASVQHLRAVRALRLLRLLRVVRALSTMLHSSNRLRALFRAFLAMRNMFMCVWVIICVTTYFFALIAMEALGDSLATSANEEWCGNYCVGFDTFGKALLSFFYLAMAGEREVVYHSIDATGSLWVALFFGVYVFLIFIVMRNLLGALVLEVYRVEMIKSRRRASGLVLQSYRRLFPNKCIEWQEDYNRELRLEAVLTQGIAQKFAKYDADGSGSIDRAEASALFWDLVVDTEKDLKDKPKKAAGARNRRGSDAVTAMKIARRMSQDITDRRLSQSGMTASAAEAAMRGPSEEAVMAPVAGPVDSPVPPTGSTADDVRSAVERKLPVEQQQVFEEMWKSLDDNNDGSIEFHEFSGWWQEFELRHLYAAHDANGDGTFNRDEFNSMLEEVGVAPADTTGVFEALDTNGDGSVGLDEFLAWWKDFDVYQSFKHYDADRSGEIDFSELFSLIKGLGIKLEKHEVADALQQLDKDNSGTVSYEEFEKYWRVLLQARRNQQGEAKGSSSPKKAKQKKQKKTHRRGKRLTTKAHLNRGALAVVDGAGADGGGASDNAGALPPTLKCQSTKKNLKSEGVNVRVGATAGHEGHSMRVLEHERDWGDELFLQKDEEAAADSGGGGSGGPGGDGPLQQMSFTLEEALVVGGPNSTHGVVTGVPAAMLGLSDGGAQGEAVSFSVSEASRFWAEFGSLSEDGRTLNVNMAIVLEKPAGM